MLPVLGLLGTFIHSRNRPQGHRDQGHLGLAFGLLLRCLLQAGPATPKHEPAQPSCFKQALQLQHMSQHSKKLCKLHVNSHSACKQALQLQHMRQHGHSACMQPHTQLTLPLLQPNLAVHAPNDMLATSMHSKSAHCGHSCK